MKMWLAKPTSMLLIAILFIISAKTNQKLMNKNINVNYGIIEIEGYKNCTIINNGETLYYSGPVKKIMPGLHFGIITYICDQIGDTIISTLKCKDCGLYCVYNEYIEGCNQSDFKFWLGVLVGCLISGIMCTIAVLILNKVLDKTFDNLSYIFQKKEDKRNIKLAKRVSSMTNMPLKVKYTTKYPLSNKLKDKISQKRLSTVDLSSNYVEL